MAKIPFDFVVALSACLAMKLALVERWPRNMIKALSGHDVDLRRSQPRVEGRYILSIRFYDACRLSTTAPGHFPALSLESILKLAFWA
jgi:hypothetical protein